MATLPPGLLTGATLALLCAAPPAQDDGAPGRRAQPRSWEHETSDLAPNERIHFGRFDSGLRFAWMANPEPDQRSYLRLHIDAGSLAEEDSELGMAHFLEHMAFNGSEHFPAGTLIEWLQERGMDFGADSNAFTAWNQTVYELDLPLSDEASLKDGLRVLRDIADGLLLLEAEIDAEKGVIDGEERERDTAGQRLFLENNRLLLDGTRVPLRVPIGTKAARDAFDAAGVRRFYERWYRPENSTLILVGDLGSLDPEPLLREAFAGWAPPEGEPDREPPLGTPSLANRFYSIHEDELPYYIVGVNRLVSSPDAPDTAAERVADLGLEVAQAMLNVRLSELSKSPEAAFLQIFVNSLDGNEGGVMPPVFDGAALNVVCQPERWREALAEGEQELRRAIAHGFQEPELEEVRAELLRALDEQVERESTRPSGAFVNDLLQAAESRSVPTPAALDRALLRPAIEKLTVASCREALARAWESGTLVIGGSGNLDLGAEAGKLLSAAWETSLEVEVEAPAAIQVATFAYPAAEEAAPVADRRHLEQVDVHRLVLENGVRVWIKSTDFRQQQILVVAVVGEGALTLEPERSALAWVATQVVSEAGLGAHSEDELRRLLAGRQAGVGFNIEEDAFSFGGGTTSEDLLLQCALTCAYLRDPGWRPEADHTFRKDLDERYEQLEHTPAGPWRQQFLPALYGGDPRVGMPSRARVDAVTLDAIRDWLLPHFADAPVDVIMVGDLDVEAAALAARRTFGHLPPRRARLAWEERREIAGPLPGVALDATIETDTPAGLLRIVFPTTDGREPATRWGLDLLGRVVADRLLHAVREKLGASYSPGAFSQANLVFPGDGTLQLVAEGDPAHLDTLQEACLAVTDLLVEKGVEQEELERLREPALAQLRDQLRNNGFWAGTLDDEATGRRAALAEALTLLDDVRAITAADVSALARRYLPRERASVLTVRPRP